MYESSDELVQGGKHKGAVRKSLIINAQHYKGQVKTTRIQILNATDRQAIDSQMSGAIVNREDGPLA